MRSLITDAVETKKEEPSDSIEEFGVPKIIVIGSGGAGCNAVDRLAKLGVGNLQLFAVNTDKQHLSIVNDNVTKILIGKSVTRGLGAGGYPEIGEKAAEISKDELGSVIRGSDMVFLCAGMGGGTGTGSAPVIAQIAKEQGAIVIAFVTYPFALEKARLIKAEEGITKLSQVADTVIVIDNNRLAELVPNLPIQDAFKVADEVVARAVRGITDTITQPSLINLDFADVRSIMTGHGLSMIAVGESSSVNKVDEVVSDTMNNALLDVDISGATGALIHITGGPELTLGETNKIGEMLTEHVDPNAAVIWGARVDPNYDNKIEVIAIFTGVHSPYIMGGKKNTQGLARPKAQSSRDKEFELSSL